MKKKIAKWLRQLADRFYPQPIPPTILPSLNDVRRMESSFDIRKLQACHAMDEDRVREYMRVNVPYNEIMRKVLAEKLVEAHITEEIIPKMQSLPQSAKDLILNGNKFIDYTSQCLIYNENTGRADSWVPSISDVFAEDWEIVCE